MFSPEATPEPAPQQHFTPQQVAQYLESLTPEQLGAMDHATLFNAREYASKAQQSVLSPYEHRAFAREASYENPLMALPIAVGTLAYQPAKMALGMSRSGPSTDQVREGLRGVTEGLHKRIKEIAQSISYKDPFGDSTR